MAGWLTACGRVIGAVALIGATASGSHPASSRALVATTPPRPSPTTTALPTTTAVPVEPAAPGPVVLGLLTFRGNETRSYYGQGPVPRNPQVLWRFPESPMCAASPDRGVTILWCGTGWTGQPAVFERQGRTWVVFGGFDKAVHFLDADTGARLLPDFPTGDIVKGSVTVDPDGFPLVYAGSRDNNFRVIAIDRAEPSELWRLPADAVTPTLWNDDWDGAGLVVDDHLFVGGENGQWHVVKLNRFIGDDGLVGVQPELVFNAPGWDEELLAALGDREVSIESSVAIWNDVVYFANSGGLIQGWDVGGLKDGRPPSRVFRFWTGDDTDATVVVDEDGMLYVASEWQRRNERGRQVGQILKLDPRRPDPVVWSVADRDDAPTSGVWATPAVYRDLVIVATDGGRLVGLDRATGAIRWSKSLVRPTWQSPVVVDDVLLQGDCSGALHAYDVSDTAVDPPELWTVALGGCIESTPAVWKDRIFVGTRAGFLVGLGDG